MRKITKAISILLAMAMLCVLMPQTAYARPKTFNIGRISSKEFATLQVTIEDMSFYGQVRLAVTETDLDKLINETLYEVDLTEAEFDQLNDPNRPLTQQEMNDIRDGLVTAAGLLDAAGLTGVGNAAGVYKALDQFDQGDYKGSYYTLYDMMPISSGQFESQMRVAADYINGIKLILQYATDSYGPINDFYRRLRDKIKDGKFGMLIVFQNARADKKTFSLFGTENTEQWTLNMTLMRYREGVLDNNTRINEGISGRYEGSYSIDIDYDLSGFQQNAKSVVLNNGWLNNFPYQTWLANWNLNLEQISYGTCNVKRTLAGEAIAQINTQSVRPTATYITPTQKSDEKNVSISDIKFSSVGSGRDTSKSVLDSEYTVSADKDTFYFDVSKWIVTYPTASTGDISDRSPAAEIPWDKEIWKRGDKAGQGWKLKVVK